MKIEMYYGWHDGGLKRWDTDVIDVPWAWSEEYDEDHIPLMAQKVLLATLEKAAPDLGVVFVGVYSLLPEMNDAIREKVADALGWDDVGCEILDRAEEFLEGMSGPELEEELEDLVEKFDEAGGRGVELADRIDLVRAALAILRD